MGIMINTAVSNGHCKTIGPVDIVAHEHIFSKHMSFKNKFGADWKAPLYRLSILTMGIGSPGRQF